MNKPTDTTTGLDQLGARQYDPSTGRFISVDPMVDQTQQPYSYAGDNPVTNTDPTGLHLEGPGACDNPAGCGQGGNGAGTGTLANGGGDPSQPAPPTGTQGGGGGGSGGGGNCYPYCGIPSQATLNSLCNKACQASAPAPPVNLEYSNVGLGYGYGYGENNWTSPWDAIYPVAIIGTTIGELSCVAPFDGICEADTTAEVSQLETVDSTDASTASAGSGSVVNLSTAGRTPEESAAINTYAARSNSWLSQNGPRTIQSTDGALRADANAAVRAERLAAERAGTPYLGQAGHVPDTAITGQANPPGGWLDMPGVSNQVCGGVLGSRVGQTISGFTVDGGPPSC